MPYQILTVLSMLNWILASSCGDVLRESNRRDNSSSMDNELLSPAATPESNVFLSLLGENEQVHPLSEDLKEILVNQKVIVSLHHDPQFHLLERNIFLVTKLIPVSSDLVIPGPIRDIVGRMLVHLPAFSGDYSKSDFEITVSDGIIVSPKDSLALSASQQTSESSALALSANGDLANSIGSPTGAPCPEGYLCPQAEALSQQKPKEARPGCKWILSILMGFIEVCDKMYRMSPEEAACINSNGRWDSVKEKCNEDGRGETPTNCPRGVECLCLKGECELASGCHVKTKKEAGWETSSLDKCEEPKPGSTHCTMGKVCMCKDGNDGAKECKFAEDGCKATQLEKEEGLVRMPNYTECEKPTPTPTPTPALCKQWQDCALPFNEQRDNSQSDNVDGDLSSFPSNIEALNNALRGKAGLADNEVKKLMSDYQNALNILSGRFRRLAWEQLSEMYNSIFYDYYWMSSAEVDKLDRWLKNTVERIQSECWMTPDYNPEEYQTCLERFNASQILSEWSSKIRVCFESNSYTNKLALWINDVCKVERFTEDLPREPALD
jgi:hypothetical protein